METGFLPEWAGTLSLCRAVFRDGYRLTFSTFTRVWRAIG